MHIPGSDAGNDFGDRTDRTLRPNIPAFPKMTVDCREGDRHRGAAEYYLPLAALGQYPTWADQIRTRVSSSGQTARRPGH
jgi:hypothetical protein